MGFKILTILKLNHSILPITNFEEIFLKNKNSKVFQSSGKKSIHVMSLYKHHHLQSNGMAWEPSLPFSMPTLSFNINHHSNYNNWSYTPARDFLTNPYRQRAIADCHHSTCPLITWTRKSRKRQNCLKFMWDPTW